jgi:hypothetical protein
MEKKIKILCYLHQDTGRDVEILLPVIYFLENYLNSSVEIAFIYDIHSIYRKKPDIVLIATNAIGSVLHHKVAKYSTDNNIPVFALISEGNFRTDGTFDYWGHNKDKKFYQEYLCMWSVRTYNFFREVLPQYKDKIVITGATGFDRYRIYKFPEKNEILDKYQLGHYKKVITYAGWAFGKLFNDIGLRDIVNIQKDNTEKYIEWMKTQMRLVENHLRFVIEKNPDILFILKRHPSEKAPHITKPDNNEMVNLSKYSNVLYLVDEEKIHDLISISDILLGFETTTVVESWLMNEKRPTIFINPDINFNRDINYKGTLIAQTGAELQKFITEFYQTGKISAFYSKELANNRKTIIKSIIGFDDGMNHIRTGYYLEKTIRRLKEKPLNPKKKIKLNWNYFMMYLLMHIGKFFYSKKLFEKLPKFKKTIWIFEQFRLKKFPSNKQLAYKYLDEFYEKNSLPTKIKSTDFWNELLNFNNETK